MKNRSIAAILKSEALDMAGTTVKQPLPTARVEQISPFLLLHHFGPFRYAPGDPPFDVGPHPHRGFEPVTFLYSGGLRHKDSRGNEGRLQGGDVQWMTAGRGIIHSERVSKDFLEEGGVLEGVQLWVNLPKKYKMVQPRYQDLKAAQIPSLPVSDGVGRIDVVAGEFQGLRGPALTYTPILALRIALPAGSDYWFPLPSQYNTMVYIVSGEVALPSGFAYPAEKLLHYRNDGEGIRLAAKTDSRLLLLAGEPIDEPVAQWGPYVMNTQTEIMQAMRDYQMGKMGVFID